MLSKQFFNRVQVTELMGFKSPAMIQRLESLSLVAPKIKPSKYSLNQVLFLLTCKEIVERSIFGWVDLTRMGLRFDIPYQDYQGSVLCLYVAKKRNANQDRTKARSGVLRKYERGIRFFMP